MGKRYCVVILAVVLTVLLTPFRLGAQTPGTEADVIKDAAALFDKQDYPAAMPLYSQLLANHPTDPNYNYRFGVCMLFANADKGKALPFLEVASKDPKAEVDVWFYLGRAYHLNYRFDEAIVAYNKYKTLAGEKKAEKMQVDNQIAMCKTGKKLLKAVTDITVLEKKELPVSNFFRSYDLSGYSGELLVKGDEFKTNIDRKKNETSIIFLSGEKNILYFSSYGDNEENGKDIYRVVRLPNGGWSKPYNVGYPINTEFDEDYPFLHPNGKVLYFCSKGHNSMGGYDIFRSELNEETQTWQKPANMDFAINSPDDDILFVTDFEEKTAWFASARNSPQGFMTVYHVVIERKPVNDVMISGTFKPTELDPNASAKITVRNEETNQPIGVYKSNDKTGAYFISLPNTGGKYTFTVEKSGIHTQTKTVFIPPQYELKPIRQEIFYTETNGDQNLNVVTYFDEDTAQFAPDFLKEKANLDVNPNDPGSNYEVVDLGNPNTPVKTVTDPVEGDPEETDSADIPGGGVDPSENVPSSQQGAVTMSELIQTAYDNADETKKEAVATHQQSDRAFTYAADLNQQTKDKQAEADAAKKSADAMPDGPDKTAAQEKAKLLQAEANALQAQTVAAYNVAEALTQDANQKDKEAKVAEEYAAALDKGSKSTGPNAMDAANAKEQELNDMASVRPQGEETAKNLQEQADQAREKLQVARTKADDAREEKKSNEALIAQLRADSAKEKDPELREGYASQIEGIQENIADNNADIKKADADVARLTNQVNELDNQATAANNALTQAKNPAVAPTPMTAEEKKALSENVVTYQNRVEDAGNPVVVAPVVTPKNPGNNNPVVTNPENNNPVVTNPENNNPVVTNPENNNPVVTNPENNNPVVTNPENNNPVVTNPENNNPVVTNPENNNPVVTNPENNYPVVTNPENNNPVVTNPENNNPANTSQPIAPAADVITDVQNNVSERIQEAENETDPEKKEQLIGQAHREAEKQIDQKIVAAETQLKNEQDPARKEQIEENLTQLREEKERQHDLAEQSDTRAEQLAASESPADPFEIYSDNIAAADTVSDPVSRENKKAQTYTDWSTALDRKIADDKKLLAKLKSKESKDSLKLVIAQDQKKSTELKQQAKQAKSAEQNAIAQQNSPGAKSDKGFADQIAAVNANPDVQAREAAKEAVYETWADSLENEATKLDALAAKERNTKKKTDIQNQATELRDQAEEKRDLAQQSRTASENAIAAQPNNPENVNPQNVIPAGAVVEENITYADPEAKNALEERNNLLKEADAFRRQQDSLIAASGTAQGEEKQDLLADATDAQRKAWEKEAEASSAQGKANNEQFTDNSTQLDNYKAAAAGNSDPKVESAGLLVDEAAVLLQRAKDKRAEAKLATSQYQRSQALDEAEELEQQALQKQQDAMAMYGRAGVQPGVIANQPKNPENNNPVVTNPENNNPVVTNPENNNPVVTNPENNNPVVTNPENNNQVVTNPENNNPVVTNPENNNPVVTNPENNNPVVTNPENNNPVVTNPENNNPVVTNPENNNPVVTNPENNNPVVTNPENNNPVVTNPENNNPVVTNPENNNPVVTNPENNNPVVTNPENNNPVVTNPENNNPVVTNPENNNPVVTNPENNNPGNARIINPSSGEPFTQEEVTQIRETPEYKNYIAIEREADASDNEAAALTRQGEQYQKSADANIDKAQDLAFKAADEPDPARKREYLDQSKAYNEQAKKDIARRDSVNDLADNARIDAKAKHSEADLYLNELDKKTYENVKAVADADQPKNNPVVTNPENNNPVVTNPVNNNPADNQPNAQGGNQSRVTNQLKPGEEFRIVAQPNANPIPVDPPVPSGIVYKVQIGAFRNPIPVDLFKGIQPLTAESVGNGITRYTAGMFTEFANADAAKREIRAMGYPDAFVVAYKDGKRISVAEARRLQGQGGSPDPVVVTPNNPTPNNPVPNNPTPNNPTPNNPTPDNQPENTFVAEATDVKTTQELFYTVQVGVYSRPVSAARLYNLNGLFSERTPNGFVRYASGKYNNVAAAMAAKDNIVGIGIKDAFVTAYFEGQRISLERAAELERSGVKPAGNGVANVQRNGSNATPQNPQPQNPQPQNPTPEPIAPTWQPEPKQPEVTPEPKQPEVTPEPVVKNPQPEAMNPIPVVANTKPNIPDTGLVFSVQLGAYKEFVPIAMANRFLLFASKGVSIYRDVNSGLTVYQVGVYADYKDAALLKDDAIAKGIADAFIVAWYNGEKISMEEALKK